jgi:tripartite-type tricarboxylate transporter receptor subunit TctC
MQTMFKVISVTAALLLVPLAAKAQSYPTRAVTIVVPFSPGGPGDIAARYIAQKLQADLGQPVIIENRPGAGGVVAAQGVAAKSPDGYTLLQISSAHTVNESLMPDRQYQLMRDFEPVAPINYTEHVLLVRNDLPVNSVAELIAYAKANPEKLLYASAGVGSTYHMCGELFKSLAGIQIQHIPYRAAGSARSDLLGGHVDMMFDALPGAVELIRSGKVKALGTTAKNRSPALPDVPTMAETLPGFENTIFIGLLAPKNTPPAILDKLNDAVNTILARPESKEFNTKVGAQGMSMTRAEFAKFLADDIAQGEVLVRISGAQGELKRVHEQ